VAYFRVLYEYFLGGAEKNQEETVARIFCIQAKDSKLGPNNNEAPQYNIWKNSRYGRGDSDMFVLTVQVSHF